MYESPSPERDARLGRSVALLAPACFFLGSLVAGAAEPPPPEKIAAPESAPVQVLDLAACRRIALERQPSIAAAQASLDVAAARAQALCKLHAIPLLASDLPIRREQAELGVGGAAAALEQARWDVTYDVTRTYLAAVFARQQMAVADEAERELNKLKDEATTAGKDRVAEQIAVYVKVVQARREQAVEGVERALAALREATGLGPDAKIAVAESELPDLTPTANRDEIVALALSRRGEITQAATIAQVTGYEVKAQASKRFSPTVRTFASASDIHAQPVPPAGRGTEYHPGALGPEMPTTLVGKRDDRIAQAESLTARADAVTEKTRGLIALEADDAFHRWRDTSRRLPKSRDAAKSARTLADKLAKDAKDPNLDVRFSEAMAAGAIASQLRLEENEVHLQQLLNLAALERVTAGGFNPGLVPAPAPQP
jgi:outer membrane protein TolC